MTIKVENIRFLLGALVIAASVCGCGMAALAAGNDSNSNLSIALPAADPYQVEDAIYTIDLNVQDDGRSVQLSSGDVLALRLNCACETGYRWQLSRIVGRGLLPLEELVFEAQDGRLGGVSTQVLSFEAQQVGASRVDLVYARPGAVDEPLERISLIVNVR